MAAEAFSVSPPPTWRSARLFSHELERLREPATAWIADYYDGRHLERAADWLLQLEPDAPEPLILAVLLHDMERVVPGGPIFDIRRTPWDDPTYNRLHCARSVVVVQTWLHLHGASRELIEAVAQPINEHELGGSAWGDLAQAADSLSWLDVNSELAIEWIRTGRCDLPTAEAKLVFMRDRVRHPRAAELTRPLCDRALAALRAGS
jgi:hypothetical protein